MNDMLLENNIFSVGTSVMVNNILTRLSIPNITVDCIVINIDTVLRNRKEKDSNTHIKRWVNETVEELKEIISELAETMLANSINNPTIVCYSADYSHNIPTNQWRNTTVNKQAFKIASKLLSEQTITPPISEVEYVHRRLKGVQPIPVQLINMIKRTTNRRHIYLISHLPIDFHICEYFKHTTIIESFTGESITLSDLNNKVFKQDTIPFNQYTHAILGNIKQFKSSLSIKEKRRLIEISKKEIWLLKTKSQIKSSLLKHGFEIPFRLI